MVMSSRRGSVILIVMWALALGALIASATQLFGYRQSVLGRETHQRVQARWAARGGIEYTLAIMADHTQYPVPDDAFAMVREMDQYARGEFEFNNRVVAGYDIRHHADGRVWWGPMDEHSKININLAPQNPALLMNFTDMSPDVVDAILDWIDEDDTVRPLGTERDYYMSLSTPYEPRNAPMQSTAELELVAGIWPEHVRGEDWNLNNRLDPNEDDGDRTWPLDLPDQRLDAGWAGLLTTYSVTGGGNGPSGLPRLRLGGTTSEVLQERLGVNESTAVALVAFGRDPDHRLEELLVNHARQQLQQAQNDNAVPGEEATATPAAGIIPLTRDELRAVLAETTTADPDDRLPGKLNINTVSEAALRHLFFGNEQFADEILYLRSSRPEGISSLVELLDIPAFREDPATLEYIAGLMDTTSNVYTICSRGRAYGSGLEVEITAVVDRSSLPIRILEYREQ